MKQQTTRFKALLPIGDKIMEDYLEYDMNMSEISKKYKVHYSNLRRYIKSRIRELGIEETFNLQYINQEDFTFLDIGDTFQFAEWLTIWRITQLTKRDGDWVFEMMPSTTRNPVRHWINDERWTG